ncbi:MAG: phospholipase D-like domain-containing protein, partial [Myxococcota bacterium]
MRPILSWTLALVALALLAPLTIGGCQNSVDPADLEQSRQPKVRVYFNFSGSRWNNSLDPEVDDMTVQMIDRAQSTIDFAIMGFSRDEVLDALMRAWDRGVRLRFVGDARHMEGGTHGYAEVDRRNIPMIVGNQFNIMHNKFFIIDDRFVITGTGNITDTGYV